MFFFFKQKTAYEMRISDWSSDVCSSDPANVATERPSESLLAKLWPRRCVVAEVSNLLTTPFNRSTRCTGSGNSKSPLSSSTGKNGRATCRERVCQYV